MAPEPITLSSVAPLVAKLSNEFGSPVKGIVGRAKEALEIKFRRNFTRFIEENRVRYSTIKTIITSSTPIPLNDIYVNLFLGSNGPKPTAHRDDDFVKEIANYKSVLFTATAGAGKSMLMKYLYLKFLEEQDERLPVFIELRELNRYPQVNLIEFITKKIKEYLEWLSEDQFRYALNSGRVILFLDGFDELNYDFRKEREHQINEIAARYQGLWIFVSSRPAETFASWEKFFIFRVQPFTESQVKLLISKIHYDADIKELFMRKLSEGLYQTHKEFLTNPLLTIMMLITLEQFAEVPAKVHLFYEYAFEALFGRHDVTKAGFQRKRHTSLALDDFKRLFSYFCMITYQQGLYSFSLDRVLDILQLSITSSQIEVDKQHYKNDLVESTCMLVMDGLEYTFSHRSFQEYFVAYFLSRVKVDEFSRALPKIVENGKFDNVLLMLSEMNKEKFEEAWALPALNHLCALVEGIDAEVNCLEFSEKIIGKSPELRGPGYLPRGVELHEMMSISFSDLPETPNAREVRSALYRVYRVFERIHSKLKGIDKEEALIWSKLKRGEIMKGDARFDVLKEISDKDRNERSVAIPLLKSDNTWLRGTHFGKFMVLESKILPQLRDEVERRVNERKKGLTVIFPTS